MNGKGNTGLHMALGTITTSAPSFCSLRGGRIHRQRRGHAAAASRVIRAPTGTWRLSPNSRAEGDESMAALRRITKEGLGNDDKAALVQCGLLKKKNFPVHGRNRCRTRFENS